jgi:15-cis-phytoene synthase
LQALLAFNAELTRIPALVSDPQIGEIRFQWWLDTLDGIFAGHAQDHPVASALARAIATAKLPKLPLDNLVKARTAELYADVIPNLNDLEGYLGETQSALIQMSSQILAGNAARQSSDAAGFAGVAFGLSDILAQQPHRKAFIPKDMENISLRLHAEKRLQEACELVSTIATAAMPAYLHVALAGPLLKYGNLGPLRRQWIIWRAARRGGF